MKRTCPPIPGYAARCIDLLSDIAPEKIAIMRLGKDAGKTDDGDGR